MAEEPFTITKKDLVNRISDKTGTTKVVVKDILQMFLDEIIEELAKGHRLEFREFGVFEVRSRAARRAQNPRTLEKVAVPAKRVVKFKIGRTMREKVCEEPAPAPKPEKQAKPMAPAPRAEPTIQKPKPPAPPPSNSPF
jgi:integration host factor subunit beta